MTHPHKTLMFLNDNVYEDTKGEIPERYFLFLFFL